MPTTTTAGDTRGRVKINDCYASTMRFPTNNEEPTTTTYSTAVTDLSTMISDRSCNLTDLPPPEPPHEGPHLEDHTGYRTGQAGSTSYGGHSVGETPGPIPNPEAKTHSADGTAPERVWESRTPPDNH
jgi:hypothetical protein